MLRRETKGTEPSEGMVDGKTEGGERGRVIPEEETR